MYLSEFIDPSSYGAQVVFTNAVSKLVKHLKEDEKWYSYVNRYGLANILAVLCWSYVNVNVPYRYDTEVFKRADYWLTPSETISTFKAGDCEDTSFLLASALENVVNMEKPNPKRYYACIGYYYDGAYWGHAFILWYNDYLKGLYVFETTWDDEVSPFVWYNWQRERYVPAIMFNRKYYGTLLNKETREDLCVNEEYVKRHEEAVKAMIDYVLTGRPLKQSWRHKTKERRVPRLGARYVTPKPLPTPLNLVAKLRVKKQLGGYLRG
ncbi:MAG: hypothetical protein QW734_07700 [Candidatus Bathyarchaeia archaeon]